jgi:hypothetical protein
MAKTKTASIAADYEYDTTKIRGKDGKVRSSRGNGDAVAKAMLLFIAGGGEIVTVVNANRLQDKMSAHMKKKGPKAPGLQRMTLGVMLRALVRNGTPVKIGKVLVEKLSQKVELPKVEKKAAAERRKPKTAKAKRKYTRRPKAEMKQAAAAAE